ncbi:coiled-coil domain-containing protein 169-like [Haliotis cracherodii]|uniref:coiled-coil domain-containing protein 169-like n=1 Tax=Haliotis cracherodii TaxID=6455 RepID=UPI0039EBD0C2
MEEEDGEDDIRAIQKLRRELHWERESARTLHVSANQWRNIVREGLLINTQREQEEVEWRIRYQYQRSFNEMLNFHIQNLNDQMRELRRGNTETSTNVGGDMLNRSLAECRLKVRHLDTDVKSMKNLRSMYERQLDQESVKYSSVKEKRSAVVKDMLFLQNICIKQQQKFEKEYFAKLRQKHGGVIFHDSKGCLRKIRPEGVKSHPSNVRAKESSERVNAKRSDTSADSIVAKVSNTSTGSMRVKDSDISTGDGAAPKHVTHHHGRTQTDKTSVQFQRSKHGKQPLEKVTYNDDIFNF